MAISPLFVGMVTHARSRFNHDGAAGEMAHSLASRIEALGIATHVLVSDRDDYDADLMPLDRSALVASALHQASLEHRWRRYLARAGAPSRGPLADQLARTGMAGKRVVKRGSRDAAVRLLNIDLSHLRLMEAAALMGAEWALILEDDAGTDDVSRAAQAIAELTRALADTAVAFASISESLSLDALGVDGLLRPAPDIPPPTGHEVLRAVRPVTNTVCATLYRADYLESLRLAILARGLVPVAPIDWRVNEVIMDMHEQGALGSQSCVWVRPGIFVQRSMHPAA